MKKVCYNLIYIPKCLFGLRTLFTISKNIFVRNNVHP